MENLNIAEIVEGVKGYAAAGKESEELVDIWKVAGIALIAVIVLSWKKFLR